MGAFFLLPLQAPGRSLTTAVSKAWPLGNCDAVIARVAHLICMFGSPFAAHHLRHDVYGTADM